VDDLDDLLRRVEPLQHLLAERALPHALDEALRDREVDVGAEQRPPHLLERLVDVGLGQPPLAAQPLEDVLQPVGQRLEHRHIRRF
jgi:hypothetical protein